MENASKALLMASGILIGILILTLMITLFMSTREISTTYENKKKEESIQKFNVNFTKYLGREDLTIHEVVTICNFAVKNGFEPSDIQGYKTKDNIKDDNNKYKLIIKEYSEDGYVNSIGFEIVK